jgi:acetyl esterase
MRDEHAAGVPAMAGRLCPVAGVADEVVGGVPCRVYEPFGTPAGTVAYFHGGGWVLGTLDTYDHVARALCAQSGARVVNVGYRVAPEDTFPAAVEDAWAVVSALDGPLAVCGDSAGGNLAAVMSQRAREDGPAIAFQLLIYPVTDHEFTSVSMEENAVGYYLTRDAMRWFYDHYLEDPSQGDDPRVSPLRAADLSGLPPAFVLTAQYDPLRDQGIAYADALRDAGNAVEMTMYEGLFHGFFSMFDLIDAGKAAFDDAIAAVVGAVA